MVRLTPSAPGGHSAAAAVPMPTKDASKNDAAMVLRMPPSTPVLDQSPRYARAQMVSHLLRLTQTVGGGNLMTP